VLVVLVVTTVLVVLLVVGVVVVLVVVVVEVVVVVVEATMKVPADMIGNWLGPSWNVATGPKGVRNVAPPSRLMEVFATSEASSKHVRMWTGPVISDSLIETPASESVGEVWARIIESPDGIPKLAATLGSGLARPICALSNVLPIPYPATTKPFVGIDTGGQTAV
jgi:hypothetical protein